jgi:hypothetical protein
VPPAGLLVDNRLELLFLFTSFLVNTVSYAKYTGTEVHTQLVRSIWTCILRKEQELVLSWRCGQQDTWCGG